MAKVHFYYSAMNAGKSTTLLQSSYNYLERGLKTLLFIPEIDDRVAKGVIASRIGIQEQAKSFSRKFNFIKFLELQTTMPNCLLIDEAQFLTKQQVKELCYIADQKNIPSLAYGLRSDFQGEPFEGSKYLLILADQLIEIKTICFCGKKATMNIRIDHQNRVLRQGEQIEIGGNDRYIAVCRKHFNNIEVIPHSAKKPKLIPRSIQENL